uniref:Uncharacterized protein n=1 Tax=Panagrellus redivivus TaxID=6233 RepID=A0A7E4VG77_PANRE
MAPKQAPKEPEFAIDYRKCTAELEEEISATKKVFEEIRKLNATIMSKLNPESTKTEAPIPAQTSKK